MNTKCVKITSYLELSGLPSSGHASSTCNGILRRQPATFADPVNGEIGGVVANQRQPEEPRPEEPQPEEPQPEEPQPEDPQPEDPQPEDPQLRQTGNETPDWCNCGLCRVMPTQEENKCCCAAKMPCITMQQLFAQLVLDGNVLDIALRLWEDVLVYENHRNNENFRHSAYVVSQSSI